VVAVDRAMLEEEIAKGVLAREQPSRCVDATTMLWLWLSLSLTS